VSKIVNAIGDFTGLSVHCCSGGTSVSHDVRSLKQGPAIVVGSVGRITDMLKRNALSASQIQAVVIDDYVGRNFAQNTEFSGRFRNSAKWFLFTSKITPSDISEAKKLCHPLLVVRDSEVDPAGIGKFSLSHLSHFTVAVENEEQKLTQLEDLLDLNPPLCFIFVATRKKVDYLCEKLQAANFPVVGVHGEMAQNERTTTMEKFNSGTYRFLVTIGNLMTGINVNSCTSVILYDFPQETSQYLNYATRCGRFGRVGKIASLILPNDATSLSSFEKDLPGLKFTPFNLDSFSW